MIAGPAHPGSECEECRRGQRFQDATRSITDDQGRKRNLCLNHALPIIHAHNLYDLACNPTGKK